MSDAVKTDLPTTLGCAGTALGTVAVALAVFLAVGLAWSVVALLASLSVSSLWLGHVNR